ncbi:MAG: hypothetical protein E6Q68_01765 [Polynucleobacter sp.]|nr:MAG: hypothetical protein E6Q68_01765 [Polynucleobacter sp.]
MTKREKISQVLGFIAESEKAIIAAKKWIESAEKDEHKGKPSVELSKAACNVYDSIHLGDFLGEEEVNGVYAAFDDFEESEPDYPCTDDIDDFKRKEEESC